MLQLVTHVGILLLGASAVMNVAVVHLQKSSSRLPRCQRNGSMRLKDVQTESIVAKGKIEGASTSAPC